MKSKLAQITGIMSIVFGVMKMLAGVVFMVVGLISYITCIAESYYVVAEKNAHLSLIIIGFIIFSFSLSLLILGISLLKKSLNQQEKFSATLVTVFVLSVFSSLVTMILAVITLCTHDKKSNVPVNITRAKATGIISVIVGGLLILEALAFFVIAWQLPRLLPVYNQIVDGDIIHSIPIQGIDHNQREAFIKVGASIFCFFGFLFSIIGILQTILGTRLIKKCAENAQNNYKNTLITILVLSVFTSWLVLVLAIVTFCTPDDVDIELERQFLQESHDKKTLGLRA